MDSYKNSQKYRIKIIQNILFLPQYIWKIVLYVP